MRNDGEFNMGVFSRRCFNLAFGGEWRLGGRGGGGRGPVSSGLERETESLLSLFKFSRNQSLFLCFF